MLKKLIIEPSPYMHITRNTNGAQQLKLSVKHWDYENLEGASPQNGLDYVLTDVTGHCKIFFDVGPSNDPYRSTDILVKRKSNTGNDIILETTGTGTGVNTIRILFIHPNDITKNRQEFVRIHVHNEMNGWWFGNNNITVPKENSIYHCQISIYGHFDGTSDQTKPGYIGDITGHGYVTLTSADPTKVELSSDGRGKLRGLAIGNTQISGSFIFSSGPTDVGIGELIDVDVVNFYGDPTDRKNLSTITAFNPILERVKTPTRPSKGILSPGIQHNILFLAEGFTEAEKPIFDQAVQRMTDRMFKAPSHTPFNLLVDDFIVWKAFTVSEESGVTDRSKCRINRQGLRGNNPSQYPFIEQEINSSLVYISPGEKVTRHV